MKLSEVIEKYGDCEVSEELLVMIEPKCEWVPKLKESYYFITGVGSVSRNTFRGDDHGNFRIAKRNCYQTEEEAQFALDMYNFCKERSFEPDWEDVEQLKYYLSLNRIDKEVIHNYVTWLNCCCPFYYLTAEAVKEIINKYSFEELEKYYGRV